MSALERMDDFFASRVDTYEDHMLNEVVGCRAGYARMAELIPENAAYLLDLGCGTGLEIDAILARLPKLAIAAIDLSGTMLARVREKHPTAAISLLRADFTKTVLSKRPYFDVAVSFESMHHLTPEQKSVLYADIHTALLDGGVYIECDYMAKDDAEEARLAAEAAVARTAAGASDEVAYHLDIPCTVAHQQKLLLAAGFAEVEVVFSEGQTVMLLCRKA